MVGTHLRDLRESSSPDDDKEHIGSTTAITGYIYFGTIFFTSISFAIWTHHNRKTRVVQASQPIFLLLICLGSFIASSSILPLTFDYGTATSQRGADVACMSVPWLLWPGCVLMYAAMFSKTWRASKVINSANRFQRVTVTARDVMVPLVVLMTLVFIVLISWTARCPLYFTLEDNGRGVCKTAQIAYPITLQALFNVTFIITAIQAWRARHISTEFSESRYIGIIMGISIVIGVLLGLLASYQSSNVSYVAWATLIFLDCMVVLVLIFVPKIVCLRKRRRDDKRKTQRIVETKTTTEQQMSDKSVKSNGSSSGLPSCKDTQQPSAVHREYSHDSVTHDSMSGTSSNDSMTLA